MSGTCPSNEGSRFMHSSQNMENHGLHQGYVPHGQIPAGQSSSMINSNQRACDTARISQWMAASSTGPEYPAYGPSCTTYASDIALTSVAPSAPGAFPVPYTDDFQFSSYNLPLEQAYVPDRSFDETCQFSRMNISQDVGQGLNMATYYDNQNPMRSTDTSIKSYGLPAGNEFTMDSHSPVVIGNNINGYDSNTNWNLQAVHDVSGSNTMVNSQPTDWTSAMTMTPSTSSLPSEHSFLSQQPDTPVSAIMLDGNWTAASGSLDENLGMAPPFTIGDAQMQSAVYYDEQRLAFFSTSSFVPDPHRSTIRQSQSQPRAPLNMEMFSAQDSETYGLPQCPTMDGSRRGSDSENRNARDHPYYKVDAQKDGLYHCPFATSDDCTHKPEKLKCNYDKHLDSHLKPYRCHKYGCAQVQFSSTACLLRHEREAHGMHGHGEKPHLCIFKDCDRSAEDNGFPRRWNLFDHMKRVHDYDPPNKGASPPSSTGSRSPPPRDVPKKRRTPSPTIQAPAKKVKIAAPQPTRPAANARTSAMEVFPGDAPQSLNSLYYEQFNQVRSRLNTLDPTDPFQWEQYQVDTATLQTIGMNIQYQQQAQATY